MFQSGGTACTHESYVLPVVIGVLALSLVMGGGAFASYYAAKHVGAPLLAALRRRQRGLDS